MEVYDEITKAEAYHTYCKRVIKTKRLPAQLRCAMKPDDEDPDGWKAKARIVGHGSFEHFVGSHNDNRFEVPDILELRLMFAMTARFGWSSGCLGVMTAFLYACLDDALDGVYLIEPPAFLVTNGVIAP